MNPSWVPCRLQHDVIAFARGPGGGGGGDLELTSSGAKW